MSEYLQVPLILFGIAYCAIAYLMHRNAKYLGRLAERAEQNLAQEKNLYFGGALFDPTRYRITIRADTGIIVSMVLVGITAVGVVYYLAVQPLLAVVIAIEAYFVFTQVDSVEAVFYSRFTRGASIDQLGRGDLEQIFQAKRMLRRGTFAFLTLGVATLFLSSISDQLVSISEIALGYYVGFLYGIAQLLVPTSKIVALVVLVLVFTGSIMVIVVAWRRIGKILARKTKGKPLAERPVMWL